MKLIDEAEIVKAAGMDTKYWNDVFTFKQCLDGMAKVAQAQLAADLKQVEQIKREARKEVAEQIASLKNDVNTLNDIVRFKTGMGQGEIDSLAVDIEAIKREARQELLDFMNTNCEHFHPDHQWQDCPCQPCYEAKLKSWGIEG